MREKVLIACAASALPLAGCATTPPSPPALQYARADCAAAPDLSRAISLTPDKKKRVWALDQPVGSNAPCLARGGGNAPYLLFSLPPAGSVRMVELGSLLEVERLFSPDVILLDELGATTRSFTPDHFMFRPGLYSVQFVPQANERFALVTADKARIGQSYDSLSLGVSSTTITTAYGATNWRSGQETQFSRGFSYEGTLRANVYALEE